MMGFNEEVQSVNNAISLSVIEFLGFGLVHEGKFHENHHTVGARQSR